VTGVPPGGSLGYTEADLQRIAARSLGRPLDSPERICDFLDSYTYLDDWRLNYSIQSVRSSLHAPRITCIDGAVLSYGLLELLFPQTKRALLAIHRRDPAKDEECGHCVTLFWNKEGLIGSFSKSSFPGLGHRPAVYRDPESVATSYARAYITEMKFEPLYFGVTTLEEAAPDLDWRHAGGSLNEISARLQACYAYGFAVE
jgi:hypothetical protein